MWIIFALVLKCCRFLPSFGSEVFGYSCLLIWGIDSWCYRMISQVSIPCNRKSPWETIQGDIYQMFHFKGSPPQPPIRFFQEFQINKKVIFWVCFYWSYCVAINWIKFQNEKISRCIVIARSICGHFLRFTMLLC